MTKIVNISSSTNWKYELDKAIWEFEQEYGISPHLYANPGFAYRLVELLQNINWIKDDSKDFSKVNGRIGVYQGTPIGFDTDVEDGVIILEA